jgi:hypothetical protein
MIREAQDNRLVHQAGFFECVEHGHDVPIGELVERICRKLYGTDAWAMITGNGSGRAAR